MPKPVPLPLKVLALTLVAGAVSCGAPPQPAAPGSASGASHGPRALVFAASGDAVHLDPGHADDGESVKVCESLYDTLVQFKRSTTEVEPALATSWETSADGLTWTFHLRQGVKFHDGTAFDADAVKFSFDRQRDPAHEMHGVGGAWQYWSSMGMDDIVASLETPDAATVVFRLKHPEAPFLSDLAMAFTSIVSPTAARASLKPGSVAFDQAPVGTGPFRFVKWDQEQSIVLDANDAYWGGRPHVDRVIFEVVKDRNSRIVKLQTGEVGMFDNPGPSELQAARAMPHVNVLQQPGMNVGYLAMNCSRKPFNDVRVRRAVNLAIDKARILADIYKGTGEVAKNPLPPSLWGYADEVQDFPHDPAQAKALLAEAGYPKGFETRLWYMPVARPYMPDGKKVAEALQLDLAAVGITANLYSCDWAVYLDKTKHGEHDMALLGWSGDNGDPDNFLGVLLTSAAAVVPAENIAFWKNPDFDSAIAQAKVVTDQAKRAELYRKAQEVFHADAPWVCLAHNLQTVVLRDDVHGYSLYPSTRKDFRAVTLGDAATSPAGSAPAP